MSIEERMARALLEDADKRYAELTRLRAIEAAVKEAIDAVKRANPALKDPFGACSCATCRRLRTLYA